MAQGGKAEAQRQEVVEGTAYLTAARKQSEQEVAQKPYPSQMTYLSHHYLQLALLIVHPTVSTGASSHQVSALMAWSVVCYCH